MYYTVTNLEAVGADMFRLVVASVTDVGHFVLTLKATSHPVVNSLGHIEVNVIGSTQL